MINRRKFLSVIIPLYNEEKRLIKLLEIYRYLNNQKFSWEIILINDGSNDRTKKIASRMIRYNSFKNIILISYKKNRGKGFAIKNGMLKAIGEHRLFIDIDLSTPLKEIKKILFFAKKFDIVIGSRKRKGAKVIKHQSRIREKLGKEFTRLSQKFLGIKVTDFTCGFKCFSANSAEKIFLMQKIERWGFDAEILFLAQKLNIPVKEIAIVWKNDSETKVRLPKDIVISFIDLFKIRYFAFRNLYSLPANP